MPVIAVPAILKEKFGDAVVSAWLDLINQVEEHAKDRTIEVVEERFERRLADELGKLRAELHDEIGKLRAELHAVRAELIKWMFLFWVGQVATITAILFAFFKR